MERVILASGSLNRQKIMKAIGIPFRVVVSQFDEQSIKETNQAVRARNIAIGKAKMVASKHKGIVIAADTFTVTGGKVMEKPKWERGQQQRDQDTGRRSQVGM